MSPILLILILFVPAFCSGLSVFFIKKKGTNFLKLILSFSGAYLFSITVLHLIPHVYQSTSTSPEILGIYVLAGFLFQLVLEQFSQGIEHGHIHVEHEHDHDRHIFPFGIMISLCLHAFLEGMPLAAGHQTQLALGISIHHIPAGFALGSILISSHIKKNKIIITLAIFAAMTPFGFLLSKAISAGEIGDIQLYFDKIMAVVIGIFLHISTTILFESGSIDHHKFNKKKMIAVLIGVGIALASYAFVDTHSHGESTPHHDHHH